MESGRIENDNSKDMGRAWKPIISICICAFLVRKNGDTCLFGCKALQQGRFAF